jgi:hypothetical protein
MTKLFPLLLLSLLPALTAPANARPLPTRRALVFSGPAAALTPTTRADQVVRLLTRHLELQPHQSHDLRLSLLRLPDPLQTVAVAPASVGEALPLTEVFAIILTPEQLQKLALLPLTHARCEEMRYLALLRQPALPAVALAE